MKPLRTVRVLFLQSGVTSHRYDSHKIGTRVLDKTANASCTARTRTHCLNAQASTIPPFFRHTEDPIYRRHGDAFDDDAGNVGSRSIRSPVLRRSGQAVLREVYGQASSFSGELPLSRVECKSLAGGGASVFTLVVVKRIAFTLRVVLSRPSLLGSLRL